MQRLEFTFEVAPHTDNAVVVEQQRFEAWQLWKALQADNHVVRQVYAVKLILQVSIEPIKRLGWVARQIEWAAACSQAALLPQWPPDSR